jgi:hypothetical protein
VTSFFTFDCSPCALLCSYFLVLIVFLRLVKGSVVHFLRDRDGSCEEHYSFT